MTADLAREAMGKKDYAQAARMFKRCLAERPSLEMFLGYADALAKCGRVWESLDVFAQCAAFAPLSPEKLRGVTTAFLEHLSARAAAAAAADPGRAREAPEPCAFVCGLCDNVLLQPVTLACGHTFCRKCLQREPTKACRRCGHKIAQRLEINVLIRSLVEKFWAEDIAAARLRDEGNQLFGSNQVEAALSKYDAAIAFAPRNYLVLSNRSHALCVIGRCQEALSDADEVVRLRPSWGKGHHRRAMALLSLGRYEESLVAFAVCAALDRNTHAVRLEAAKSLQKILSTSKYCSKSASQRSSLNSRSSLKKYHSRTSPLQPVSWVYVSSFNSNSDCDDNSSGDEDSKQPFYSDRRYTYSSPVPQDSRRLPVLMEKAFQEIESIRWMNKKLTQLTVDSNKVEITDFDCVLCCRTLWQPTTTFCGHSYCSACLDRCLDYNFSCPLCMTSLTEYLLVNQKNITEFLDLALRTALPTVYATRFLLHRQEISEPHMPVFVCTTAFPHVPCPLFIFEPRYRLMVRRCIESGTRQFAMAACLNSYGSAKRYAEYGTILEIKNLVLLNDGCSILSTVGVRRFRILSRGERDGYDTASIANVCDVSIPSNQIEEVRKLLDKTRLKGEQWLKNMSPELQSEILRTFGPIPDLEENWGSLPDGPAWVWWLLAILPLDQRLQVGILATTCIVKRLLAIYKTLELIERNSLVVAQTNEQASVISASVSSSYPLPVSEVCEVSPL
nr:PREDICTED: LON peptidase N-terminal domain and RING finger protein 3 [Bemisia tabaci]